MRSALITLVLTAAPLFAATAPDSIAGKVYREASFPYSIRSLDEQTIVFRPDGRYVYLKLGTGSVLGWYPYKNFLRRAPADGRYTYTRTADASATVVLTGDDGTKQTILLRFTSATGGADNEEAPLYTFTLTDAAGLANAPATNVSVRGRVDSAHPLIVGFVVPGTPVPSSSPLLPDPGRIQREVLIRVVGPSLVGYGITGFWADPDFALYAGSSPAPVHQVHYPDWSANPPEGGVQQPPDAALQASFQKIFSFVGAFPLVADSKDAADVVRLDPGSYTIVASAAPGDPGGEALVEVYFLP